MVVSCCDVISYVNIEMPGVKRTKGKKKDFEAVFKVLL